MDRRRYIPFAALAAAGLLWGLTVPLSKLAMGWLDPAWLTVARFAVSAPILAIIGRRSLREALHPRVGVAGAIGFGGVIVLQNAGIERTSVSHAAVILGTVPVLVALVTAALGQNCARPRTWGGSGLALGGIALVAGVGGGSRISPGDLLVLASAVLSAGFIAAQPRLLKDRDPAAVTAVQFAAGGLIALPIAAITAGAPAAPVHGGAVSAYVALSLVGTLLPFWLFAFGQARVPADVAGAFVNLEPLVGAAVGWLALGDTASPAQIAGAFAVLAGILVGTMPQRGKRVGPELDHQSCEGGRIRGRRIRRSGPRQRRSSQRQRRTVPMTHSRGRGPQNRLSLAWPRLSPIRK